MYIYIYIYIYIYANVSCFRNCRKDASPEKIPKAQEYSFVKHYQRHFIKLFFLKFSFKNFQQQFNLMSTSSNKFVPFI